MNDLLLMVTIFSGLNLLGTAVVVVKISFWAGGINARVQQLERRADFLEVNGD